MPGVGGRGAARNSLSWRIGRSISNTPGKRGSADLQAAPLPPTPVRSRAVDRSVFSGGHPADSTFEAQRGRGTEQRKKRSQRN